MPESRLDGAGTLALATGPVETAGRRLGTDDDEPAVTADGSAVDSLSEDPPTDANAETPNVRSVTRRVRSS
jgi:hypothetical protein